MSQNRREGGGILWPLKLAPSPPWKFSSYTPAYIPTPQINPQLLEMVMIKIKIDSFPIHILNHCSRPRCNICNVLTYESIGSCFYWVGIQQHFLRTEELTRWKWLFYQISSSCLFLNTFYTYTSPLLGTVNPVNWPGISHIVILTKDNSEMVIK